MAGLAKTLVAAVSHDLRAPLARIKASSSTLADPEIDIEPQVRQSLAAMIDRQADRLAELVQNLLDMSRIQAGVLQPRRGATSLPALWSPACSATYGPACAGTRSGSTCPRPAAGGRGRRR